MTKVGGGPAISFMDGGTIVKPKMFDALKRAAKEAGIPFQIRQGTARRHGRGRNPQGHLWLHRGRGVIRPLPLHPFPELHRFRKAIS